MRVLIIESVANKPHLETSGDIALSMARDRDVLWAWLGDDLPWSDWDIPSVFKLLGGGFKNRILRFEQILGERGVTIVSSRKFRDKLDKRVARDAIKDCNFTLESLKKFQFKGISIGMGVASSLISYYSDCEFEPARHKRVVRKCLISSILVYLRALRIIEIEKPDVVITFNGRFATCRPIVLAAQQMNIDVLRHERGSSYEKYELYDGNIHDFKYIATRVKRFWDNADDVLRNEKGHDFFLRKRQGDGISWHSLVSHQIRGLCPEKAISKKRVVYFSSSEDEFAAISDAACAEYWMDQFDAISAIDRACRRLGDQYEFVVRVHPNVANKSKKSKTKWDDLQHVNCTLIRAEDKVDSYALLASADIVASFGSTIGLESVYWGKPLMLFGPAPYADTAIAYVPKNEDDIIRYLSSDLLSSLDERQRMCLPYGFYYLMHGYDYRHYRSNSLSEGSFCGDCLHWKSKIILYLDSLFQGHFRKLIKKIVRGIHGF